MEAAVSIGANSAEDFGRRRPLHLGYSKDIAPLLGAMEDISRMLRRLVDATLKPLRDS